MSCFEISPYKWIIFHRMSSPGFGFSVGDFIAGIKLAEDVVHAPREDAGARLGYQNLTGELRTSLCGCDDG
jgi:hypothetical protein